jgi:hypothetical protein
VRRKRQVEKIRENKVSVARADAETAQLHEAAVKAASVAAGSAAAGRAESTPSPRSIRSDRAEVRQHAPSDAHTCSTHASTLRKNARIEIPTDSQR